MWVAARQRTRLQIRQSAQSLCVVVSVQLLPSTPLLPSPTILYGGDTCSWPPFGPRPTKDSVSSFISLYFL